MRKRAIIGTAAFAVLAAALMLLREDDDPQGGTSAWCDSVPLTPSAGPVGVTVGGHTTACSGFGGSVATYVYVYPNGQHADRANLVLRYFEASDTQPPAFRWLDSNQLEIRVNHVSEVTKRVGSKGGVRISFVIERADFSVRGSP